MGRRRGGGLGHILNDIARSRLEWANGKIRFVGGLWRFVGTNIGKPPRSDRLRTSTCRSTGRSIELVSCRSVFCPNPEMDGQYPRISEPQQEPRYDVPASVCARCQHRGKRGENRVPYAHCKWAREQRGGPQGALKSVLGILNEAAEDTKKILKGVMEP